MKAFSGILSKQLIVILIPVWGFEVFMNKSRVTWLSLQPLFFVLLLCLCSASTLVLGLNAKCLGPHTVLWISVKDAKGDTPYWMNTDKPEGAALYLEKLSKQRGISLVLPLFDLTDTSIVTEQNAQAPDWELLQKASQRYHAEAIVFAKLEQTQAGDQWVGEWTAYINGKISNFETRPADFNAVLNAGLSGFLTRLVGQTAEPRVLMAEGEQREKTSADYEALQKIENQIEQSQADEANTTKIEEQKKTIKLAVSGIMGVEHYAKVLEYLKHLPTVTEVAVMQITPSQTIFQIDSALDKEVFAESIDAGKFLIKSFDEAFIQDALCYKIAE